MSFPQLRSPNSFQLAAFATITTQAATSIADVTATGNGTIINLGGSPVADCGFVWGTSINPVLGGSSVSSGAGAVGAFTGAITGLSAITTYFYRAYATNSIGTSYGDNQTFTTTSGAASNSNFFFFFN